MVMYVPKSVLFNKLELLKVPKPKQIWFVAAVVLGMNVKGELCRHCHGLS